MIQTDYPDPRQGEAEAELRLRDMEAGLAYLTPEQREVLLLICLEEMTYEQIAQTLGVPIGTVMSRLHRGRERLRRWMAGELEQRPALRRVK